MLCPSRQSSIDDTGNREVGEQQFEVPGATAETTHSTLETLKCHDVARNVPRTTAAAAAAHAGSV